MQAPRAEWICTERIYAVKHGQTDESNDRVTGLSFLEKKLKRLLAALSKRLKVVKPELSK